MLLMPTTHRLAGRESVTLDDFADEPLIRYPDPAYDAFWRLDPDRTDARHPTARWSRRTRTNSNPSPAARPSPWHRPPTGTARPGTI